MNQVNISYDNGKYSCNINGNSFKTTKQDYVEYMHKKITGTKLAYQDIISSQTPSVSDKFCINTRFGFVEKLVKMVASGVQPSAIVTGAGGLGKTFTVIKTLQEAGFKDASVMDDSFEVGMRVNTAKQFVTVKGYSTAKGLYRTLFENNKSVIVFDDCDAVLKDPVALNILKGALDSYGRRVISWNADMRDEDLPRSFNFEGKVIFISNMDQNNIDQAIRTRSMMIDLSMNVDQKIDRMAFIATQEEFMPEFEMAHKLESIELIKILKDSAKDVSLRTLISVTKIRSSGDEDWKSMAEYVLCA